MLNIKLKNKISKNLINQWTILWKKSQNANFFNSPYWFLSCVNAFNIKQYSVFCGYYNDNLCIVFPTIYGKKYFVKSLMSPGKKYLDKSTLLFDDSHGNSVNYFLAHIAKSHNIFIAETIYAQMHIYKNKKYCCHEFASDNPFIDLTKDPFGHLKNKQKNSIKNKIRQNRNLLEFKLITPKYEDIKTIIHIESQSYKSIVNKDIFNLEEAKNLFLEICKYSKNARIAILYFKNKPIAHLFGLSYKETFMAYHMAYHNDYRKIVPGKIILFYLLTTIKKKGYKIFDFSRGASLLKSQFTEHSIKQYNVYLTNSMFVCYYWRLILNSKQLIKDSKTLIKQLYSKIHIAI